jgi:hypothetical protein
MNSKALIVFLSLGIITLSILHYRNNQYHKNERLNLSNHMDFLKEKNLYLERCLNYRNNIDQSILNTLPEGKNVLIYYSGESCSFCVEEFLKEYKDNKGIRDKIIVVSDEKDKDNLTFNFNDAYNTNYSHKVDTTKYFKSQIPDDVLFLRIDNNQITSLLTYSYQPEEKQFFLEFASKPFRNR